jgi:uncharacterized protein
VTSVKRIRSGDLQLAVHVSHPPATSAKRARFGLVLCHGFPAAPRGAGTTGQSYPELADRLAAEAGWTVVAFNFRGTGESPGDFSLSGWMADLSAAIDFTYDHEDVNGVWLAGFSTGGALALCAAGEDQRVRGVATFAAPADFDNWASDPLGFLEHARAVGVIRDTHYPPDFEAWSRDLIETRPLQLVGKIPPRPLLLIHGADDDVVSPIDARALADAADHEVELTVLSGAGHRLRHDPRAIAVLLGWLDRQA